MDVYISLLMPAGETREMFVTPAVIKAFEQLGSLRVNDGEYSPEKIKRLLEGCQICVTGWGCPSLNEGLISEAEDLRLVAHTGGSVASLVSDYLYDRGIRVISGNKLYAESVAEGALAYMLAALRRIPYYNGQMQNGVWKGATSDCAGVLDKRVGLVGFGAIPRYLVPMLKAFRADITAYDPYVDSATIGSFGIARAETMEELFSECEIISNHLPRTKATYHLIDARMFGLMRDGAVFVNTARGSTVDEEAMARAAQSGRIFAALDVYESEPLPLDSKLRGLDNVILMPHMGGPTRDRCERVGFALAADIRNLLEGKPLVHEISREYAAGMTNDVLKL